MTVSLKIAIVSMMTGAPPQFQPLSVLSEKSLPSSFFKISWFSLSLVATGRLQYLSIASTIRVHNTKPSKSSIEELLLSSEHKCNTRTTVSEVVLLALSPAKNFLVTLHHSLTASDGCAPSEEPMDVVAGAVDVSFATRK